MRQLRVVASLLLCALLSPALALAQVSNGSGTDYQSPALTLTGSCAQPGACATGTFADFQTAGTVMTVVQITAISNCTLNFGVSSDGTNIAAFNMLPLNSTSGVSTASAVGTWTNPTGQFAHFYVWTTGCTGSVTFTVRLSSTAPQSLASAQASVSIGSSVSVNNFPATQPISGTITATQATGTNLHMVCDSGCSGAGAWQAYVVPASASCVSPAVCVVKSGAGTLAALINESTSPQPAGNCELYDNASAASGTVLYIENSIGAGQVITFTPYGIKTANGIVIQCAANPGGSGLLVLYE